MIESNSINFFWYGLSDYQTTYQLQLEKSDEVRQNPTRVILMAGEHPGVITLGKRGDALSDVVGERVLPMIVSDRGGQATIHSEGQLVIYPIINLKHYSIGVASYIELLHEVTSQVLKDLGVETKTQESAGLYTDAGKIVSVGVRVDRGVTRHGIAINNQNDLGLFDLIRVCGVSRASDASGAAVDSLSRRGLSVDNESLFKAWCEAFKNGLAAIQ